MNFPSDVYQIILADPPWDYGKGVYQDKGRNDRLLHEQYQTMSKKDLKQLPVVDIAWDDCALFLWVTDSHLKDGVELIEAWGFTYRTVAFVWEKVTCNGKLCANVGAWTMKNCELCLLGIRGNMLQYKEVNNVYQLVKAERTKHSQKPDEVRKRIELLFGDMHRIELFARQKVIGWDSWGNESCGL